MRPQTFTATLTTSNKEVIIRWRPESHLPSGWVVEKGDGTPLGVYAVPACEGWRSLTPSPAHAWNSRPSLVTEGEGRFIDRIEKIREVTETKVSNLFMDLLVQCVRPTHSTIDGWYAVVHLGSVLEQAYIGPDERNISQSDIDAAMCRAGWEKIGARYQKPVRVVD